MTPSPLRTLSTAPQSVPQLCARALVHAAAPSLPQVCAVSGGRCAAECHITNEFLLTARSPLKKQFVLKRRCAELPCSCLCSHVRRRCHLLSALFCHLRRLSLSPVASHCLPRQFPLRFNQFSCKLGPEINSERAFDDEQVAALKSPITFAAGKL